MSDISKPTELSAESLASSSPAVLSTTLKTLETFPRFPKLPLELRNMIWKLSFEARTISIEDFDNDKLRRATRTFRIFNGKPTFNKILIYGVCREAQSIVKKNYNACFAQSLWGRPILINFNIDKLHFVDRSALFAFYYGKSRPDAEEMEKNLRFLSFGEHDLSDSIRKSIGSFEKLETLSLERKSGVASVGEHTGKGLEVCWRKSGFYEKACEPKIEWVDVKDKTAVA